MGANEREKLTRVLFLPLLTVQRTGLLEAAAAAVAVSLAEKVEGGDLSHRGVGKPNC